MNAQWAAALRSLVFKCQNRQGLHEHCQSQAMRPLPSRILYITGELGQVPKIRLHVPTMERGMREVGQYATLSYCWGGPQQLKLARDNISTFRRGGYLDKGWPQTFKDAILTTQILGLSYLWIDALCIIQDDPDDKGREIDHMCSIYENSAVTIVAATARSVHDGFLRPVNTFNETYPSCEVEVSTDNKRSGKLSFVPVHAHHTEKFPINKRGWTFQEALISPRLLVFGDLEPFLRCRGGDAISVSKSHIRYDISRIQPRRIMNRDLQSEGLRQIWPEVVEQYTLRELSFVEDRPQAIKGVIASLSHTFRESCHWGIWESCPVSCLVWQKSLESRPSSPIPGIPTWSWMSITGQVNLWHMVSLGNYKGEALVEIERSPLFDRLLLTCCVLREEEVRRDGNLGEIHHDFDIKTPTPRRSKSFLLILAKTTFNGLLAIIAGYTGNGTYWRYGLAEIKDPDKWLSKPRKRILLM